MAAHPGSDIPSASASAFIVEAVPMVLQWPTDGAEAAAISRNSRLSMRPAASSSRAFQTTVPAPARSPFHQPLSIGPPERTIAGVFKVMTIAGGEVRTGLGDANNWLARPQFGRGKAVVEIALEIERRHAGVFGVVEPKL